MRGEVSVRLQVRVPMDLGRTIQDRAKENCRSISQEAEWLLFRRFERRRGGRVSVSKTGLGGPHSATTERTSSRVR